MDYDYTTPITWGYHLGCSFIQTQCVLNNHPQFEEFCNETTAVSYCDATHTYKGFCALQQNLSLPLEFQYFSDPKTGGTDSLLDHCPIVVPEPDGSCRVGTLKDPETYGEEVCDNCRCLEGTYTPQLTNSTMHHHAGCHKVTCNGNTAVIHIGGEVAHCTPSGGSVKVRGYNGLLYCPGSDVLCRSQPCVSNCHGRGKCKGGLCECEEGYSGKYCELSCVLSLALLVLYLV